MGRGKADRRTGRVTSRDVAARSGVSQATVSYVINNTPTQSISPATRDRVLKAAAELGYVPHESARALRKGQSKLALLVIPAIEFSFGLGTMIDSMQESLASIGLTLVLHEMSRGRLEFRHMWRAIAPSVVISLGALTPRDEAEIKRAGISVASFRLSDREHARGLIDHQERVGAKQIEYLYERGHRHLGYAVPTTGNVDAFLEPRRDGARTACERLGLPAPLEFEVVSTRAGVAAAIEVWQAAGIEAVCAYNDDVAFAVMAGAARRGCRVPEDLAVIGVDDVPFASLSQPSLTTIQIDFQFLAQQLVEFIISSQSDAAGAAPADPFRISVVARESA